MHRRKETADVIFDFFRRKEHHRRPVASPTTPLLCTKRGKTLSDHVFRDPKGNTLCISCLPEHLQESAYRYAESLDTLAAGPEREAGDGSPLRSAICSASQTPKISAQIVYTGGRAPSNRRRQTLAATTSMTTSTGLATGFGKSPYSKTSGPPYCSIKAAFVVFLPLRFGADGLISTRRVRRMVHRACDQAMTAS